MEIKANQLYVNLTGDEVAEAIYQYLMQHKALRIFGPRTVKIDKKLCKDIECSIFIDPSGSIETVAGIIK
jgi:hypothetical protein